MPAWRDAYELRVIYVGVSQRNAEARPRLAVALVVAVLGATPRFDSV